MLRVLSRIVALPDSFASQHDMKGNGERDLGEELSLANQEVEGAVTTERDLFDIIDAIRFAICSCVISVLGHSARFLFPQNLTQL